MTHGRFAFHSWYKQENINVFTMDDDGCNLKQLTDSPGFNYCPAFSPDGNQIAFVSGREGNDDIFVMNFDGTDQRRITNNTRGGRSPHFSPDGQRIVFCSSDEGGHAVYVMNVDGTNRVKITYGSPPYNAVFTADGNSVIYDDHVGFFYMVGIDGRNQLPLSSLSGQSFGNIAVSPKGERVALVESICYSFEDDYYYNYAIFTANLDGSNLTKLTGDFVDAFSPVFSPDGCQIAFVGQKDAGGSSAIYTSDIYEIAPNRVTDGTISVASLTWAPIQH